MAGDPGHDFPNYTLMVDEKLPGGGTPSPLAAEFVTTSAEVDVSLDAAFTGPLTAGRAEGTVPIVTPVPKITIPLNVGTNIVRFLIEAEVETDPRVKQGVWTGFQWSKMTREDSQPSACSPGDPWYRWKIERDYGCDGTWESDATSYWEFNVDGTISDYWVGEIDDYLWHMDGDKTLIVTLGPGYGYMQATFAEDCGSIENGTYVDDFSTQTCWKTEQF